MRTLGAVATIIPLSVAISLLVTSVPAESPVASGTPKQVAYSHYLRFRILQVLPVEQTPRRKLFQLKVQRWYGKIDERSHDLHKKYDTQELTLLFPAAPDAVLRVGDIIDYRIVRYIGLDSSSSQTRKSLD